MRTNTYFNQIEGIGDGVLGDSVRWDDIAMKKHLRKIHRLPNTLALSWNGYWKTSIISLRNDELEPGLWCSGLSHYWHPLWVLIQIPAVLLPMQLLANGLGKAVTGSQAPMWEIERSRLLASGWPTHILCNHLGNEPQDGRLISLYLPVCVCARACVYT